MAVDPDPHRPALLIGEVAARAGVTVETLRYYEAEGLLTVAREPGGRRRYSPHDLDTVLLIGRLRDAGFGVRAIERVLASGDRTLPPLARVRRGLTEVDACLAELDRREDAVRRARVMLEGWRAELTGYLAGETGGSDAAVAQPRSSDRAPSPTGPVTLL